MTKFSKKNMAILLVYTSLLASNASSMNQQDIKIPKVVSGEICASDDKDLKKKFPTKPKGINSKFYPLYGALSVLGVSALAICCVKKLCSFVKIEKLKKIWQNANVLGEGVLGAQSPIGKQLVKLRTDNPEFGRFLDQDHSQDSELATLQGDQLSKTGYNFFSNYAELRFDGQGGFDCYHNGKKINLLYWERFFIKFIVDYTKDKLGILPCMVRHDGLHSFYFEFAFNLNNEDFKKDSVVDYNKHTLIKNLFSTHINPDNTILCQLDMWGKI